MLGDVRDSCLGLEADAQKMPNHPMTPHVSGTSLEAQKRYADGIRDCLVRFFEGQPIERDYLIVDGGKVVSPSYSYAYET